MHYNIKKNTGGGVVRLAKTDFLILKSLQCQTSPDLVHTIASQYNSHAQKGSVQ